MVFVARPGGLLLKTVLQLQLGMPRESLARREIDPPKVLTAANTASRTIIDFGEELLIPPQCAEDLRREFVFRLKIVSECIRVAHTRNFETRFVKFRPQLQMVPSKTDILAENQLPVIIDIAPPRQCSLSFRPKIRAVACRPTKVPYLLWPIAKAGIEGRLIETNRRDVPRFRARRERRVFHFSGVIELAEPA